MDKYITEAGDDGLWHVYYLHEDLGKVVHKIRVATSTHAPAAEVIRKKCYKRIRPFGMWYRVALYKKGTHELMGAYHTPFNPYVFLSILNLPYFHSPTGSHPLNELQLKVVEPFIEHLTIDTVKYDYYLERI